MTLISFPPISWYLFSLSIPTMEKPTSKEPLPKPDTIYYSLASSAIRRESNEYPRGVEGLGWGPWCGCTFQLCGERYLEESILPSSWNPRISKLGEVKITEPRPYLTVWGTDIQNRDLRGTSHTAEKMTLKPLEMLSYIKDIAFTWGREF